MPPRCTIILLIITETFFLTSALTSVREVKGPRPFEVSISVRDEFACAGVIITIYWIFTVASCVQGYEKQFLSIRAGSNDTEFGGQVRKVNRLLIHPMYQWQTNDYNLAGLKASKRFTFGVNVRSIQIAVTPVHTGQNLYTSGWDYNNGDGQAGTYTKATVKVVSHDECQLIYSDDIKITPRMLCVWSGNRSIDVCPSWLNQGQPLMNAWGHLIGLYSFTLGFEEYPAIFTNLENLKWAFQNNSYNFNITLSTI